MPRLSNRSLGAARKAKDDEFYTQLRDIENELWHYRQHFHGEVVYCNCDDPKASKFHHFFRAKFKPYGLKKLITTCYKNQNPDIFSQHDCEKAIREFMAKHAIRVKKAPTTRDPAKHLYDYFKDVMDWVKATFTEYHEPMQGIAWGELHAEFGGRQEVYHKGHGSRPHDPVEQGRKNRAGELLNAL